MTEMIAIRRIQLKPLKKHNLLQESVAFCLKSDENAPFV